MITSGKAVGLTGTRTLAEWEPEGNVSAGFDLREVVVGRDDAQLALEVVVLDAGPTASTSREALGSFHAARLGKRVSPVVVLARRGDQAWLFGPNAQAAVVGPVPADQAQRMLQSALDEPSGLAARQRLAGMFAAIEGTRPGTETDYLPGVANAGLFATHELRHGARRRADWSSACDTAEPLLRLRREALIEALGYTAQSVAAHALILLAEGVSSRAVAVLLDENESFDGDSSRFSVSPVAYAVSIAQKYELSWVMILRGSQLRLYPARAELGVGRKGLAETYFEIDLALVTDESAGFLPLVFSASALSEQGSTAEILDSSAQYAVALGERLRDQVYEHIVPRLSLAIADQLPNLGRPLDRDGLDLAYQLTLRVFFRLLFQAYAEDRKLLPYGENPRYDRNALNTLARDLAEDSAQEFDANSSSMWDDLAQVWHVIDKGDTAWSVPPYNGGLFGCDPELQPEGELLERITVTNDVMGLVLRAMLIDTADGVTGPIDFRSLSVREFGTIYEGLLESNLAVADTDLVLDEGDTWVPATPGDTVDPERSAVAGSVYFHNTSGQRKGTGSYFTPSFVVEHLLERALDPTLEEHLGRVREKLDAGDQAGAADLFFDFRVADLAMGSGHFLTAAIDHLETGMAAFLAENPIPGVTNELRHLEQAARNAIGPDALDPEPSSLLRRQIARRCIYGLDINPIAVELARVSIWIHTFVRGLPMSSLDHNLVCANSLSGIGTVEEALDALVPERGKGMPGTTTIFDAPIHDALEAARQVLQDVASAAEATRKEAQDATRASRKAHDEGREASLLFDAAVLRRVGRVDLVDAVEPAEIARRASDKDARAALAWLKPAHMPALFPEVFLRPNRGFDVLIGNPPWEKLKVEEHQWWGLRFPGLRGSAMRDREIRLNELRRARPDLVAEYATDIAANDAMRRVMVAGPYPGIAAGDVDLYKAFAWRNWQLLADRGHLGIVLPRVAMSGPGTEIWRRDVLSNGTFEHVCMITNTARWVFEMEPRYTVAFVIARRGGVGRTVAFSGPFQSLSEFLEGSAEGFEVGADEFLTWTPSAMFPMLADHASAEIFRTMRRSPSFDGHPDFDLAPVREIETTERTLFDTRAPLSPERLPVYSGANFNLWNPDTVANGTGSYFATADRRQVIEHLYAKARRLIGRRASAFHGLQIADETQLPIASPRIMYRDIARATDSRTVIAALVPPFVSSVEMAPYLLARRATARDEAFVLGVLSSILFDWYARRIVEMHLKFNTLGSLPIPRIRGDLASVAIEISGRLAAQDARFEPWAKAVGVSVGSLTTGDKFDLITELDAVVSRLYGLSREQVCHVFATFHRGWDYEPRLAKVLTFFDALEGVE